MPPNVNWGVIWIGLLVMAGAAFTIGHLWARAGWRLGYRRGYARGYQAHDHQGWRAGWVSGWKHAMDYCEHRPNDRKSHGNNGHWPHMIRTGTGARHRADTGELPVVPVVRSVSVIDTTPVVPVGSPNG